MHFEFYKEGSGPIRSAPHLIQLGQVDVNPACAQQSSQMDCNIRLPHPTHTIQKFTEDLSEGKSKPSSTFFSQSVGHLTKILKKCYHLQDSVFH